MLVPRFWTLISNSSVNFFWNEGLYSHGYHYIVISKSIEIVDNLRGPVGSALPNYNGDGYLGPSQTEIRPYNYRWCAYLIIDWLVSFICWSSPWKYIFVDYLGNVPDDSFFLIVKQPTAADSVSRPVRQFHFPTSKLALGFSVLRLKTSGRCVNIQWPSVEINTPLRFTIAGYR